MHSGNNILPLFGGGFPGFNQEGFFSPEKGRGSTQSLKTWDTSREDELSQCSSAMSLQTEQPPIGGLPSLLAHSSSEEGQRESSNQPSGDKTCWNTNECVGDESACAWALIPKTPKKARRPVVQSSPRKKKFANAATMNYTTALPRSCLLAKFAIAIDAQTPALSATTGNTKQAHQGLSENTGRGAFRESGPSKQTLAQSRTPLGCENRPPQSLPEHASLTLANVVAPKKRTKRGAQTVCEFLHRNSLQPTICTSSLKHEYCQKRHALMEQLEMGQYPCEDEHGGLFPAPVIQPGSNPPRVLLRQKGFEERIAGLMHMRQLHLCHEKRAQREHQPYLLLFPDKNLTASPLARLLNSPKLHSGYFFGPDGKCQTDTCILVCNLFKHTSLSRLAMERGDIDQSDKVAFSSYVMWLFNLPMESELSTPFSKKVRLPLPIYLLLLKHNVGFIGRPANLFSDGQESSSRVCMY